MGKLGKGRILNHSAIPLLVLETDSGNARVHTLGPRRKTPETVDADAFKRSDGEAILIHKGWWKIVDSTVADLWPLGDDLLIPTSFMLPVADDHFGPIQIDNDPSWGEPLTYVTSITKDKKGHVVGYQAEKFGELTKVEAIRLTQEGKLDNVVVVENSKGTLFLRTKKNTEVVDNLT